MEICGETHGSGKMFQVAVTIPTITPGTSLGPEHDLSLRFTPSKWGFFFHKEQNEHNTCLEGGWYLALR